MNIKNESKQFTDTFDKMIWNGVNNSYLSSHLQNGYLASQRTIGILSASVKVMRKDASQINITRKNGYINAKWYTNLGSETKFLTEIPILAPKEKMTRVESEKLVIDHIEQKIRAATYFKNLFKIP